MLNLWMESEAKGDPKVHKNIGRDEMEKESDKCI
jgi:hypothetical protein